jgi:UDP-glucose:tetrahydrobiopterin glucosyltransferase
MRIAYVCIVHKPLGKHSTGGIEQFTVNLLHELIKRGHQVDLYASEETDMSAFPGVNLIPVFQSSDLSKKNDEKTDKKEFVLTYAMLQYSGFSRVYNDNYDVVHVNCPQWYVPLVMNSHSNHVLTTIHGLNLRQSAVEYVLKTDNTSHIACVSEYVGRAISSYPNHRVIHNGIDMTQFSYNENGGNIFGWLGRIAPVKGLSDAVLASQSAGVKFEGHGPNDFVEYFQTQVEPNLNEHIIVGSPISGVEKASFLCQLRALLMPVHWDESFALTPLESLASGTPVIAYDRGSLSEVIQDGMTGFLVTPPVEDVESIDYKPFEIPTQNLIIKQRGIEGITEAIKIVQNMSDFEYTEMRKNCRKVIEEKFTLNTMVEKYIQYYQDIGKT